jgi:hypothetical protein
MPCKRSNFRPVSRFALFTLLLIFSPSHAFATGVAQATSEGARSRIEAALTKMMTNDAPKREALAMVWDGNAYIQCRRTAAREMHCEAAGALMQSSLERILTPKRVNRLVALGWELDPSFGNYAQIFPESTKVVQISEVLLASLKEVYGANPADLEFENTIITREVCPLRNGPSQNLAGSINDAKETASFAVHACAYTPPPPKLILLKKMPTPDNTVAKLVASYRLNVIREIERLRVTAGINGYSRHYRQVSAISNANQRKASG